MCSRAGLLPNDALEMSFDQIQAVIDGYSDRLLDSQINCVWSGYFAGYYQSKKPKPPHKIIDSILRNTKRKLSKQKQPVVDIDSEIEHFAEMDAKRFLAQQGGDSIGN